MGFLCPPHSQTAGATRPVLLDCLLHLGSPLLSHRCHLGRESYIAESKINCQRDNKSHYFLQPRGFKGTESSALCDGESAGLSLRRVHCAPTGLAYDSTGRQHEISKGYSDHESGDCHVNYISIHASIHSRFDRPTSHYVFFRPDYNYKPAGETRSLPCYATRCASMAGGPATARNSGAGRSWPKWSTPWRCLECGCSGIAGDDMTIRAWLVKLR